MIKRESMCPSYGFPQHISLANGLRAIKLQAGSTNLPYVKDGVSSPTRGYFAFAGKFADVHVFLALSKPGETHKYVFAAGETNYLVVFPEAWHSIDGKLFASCIEHEKMALLALDAIGKNSNDFSLSGGKVFLKIDESGRPVFSASYKSRLGPGPNALVEDLLNGFGDFLKPFIADNGQA